MICVTPWIIRTNTRAVPSFTNTNSKTVDTEDLNAEAAEIDSPLFAGVKSRIIPTGPIVLKGGLDPSSISLSPFPLSEEELIELTKQFLNIQFGSPQTEAGETPINLTDVLAHDFKFVAPVVGPLGKEAFVDAFSSFRVSDAFPDGQPNYYNFHRDPFEPNRIWFVTHFFGTNTGSLAGFLPVTNKKVETPPQAQSCTFNERGEITKFTIGYVMDKEVGNTGGLGGVYGLFYAIGYGLPFPEGQPWKPSPPYFVLTRGGSALSGLVSQMQKLLNL